MKIVLQFLQLGLLFPRHSFVGNEKRNQDARQGGVDTRFEDRRPEYETDQQIGSERQNPTAIQQQQDQDCDRRDDQRGH